MNRVFVRCAIALPLFAVGLGATSAVAHVGPAAPLCAQASYTHHVGLVVEHGDGRVIKLCIGFDSPTLTALAVLQASGLETGLDSYGGLGTAVCQIDHEPIGYTTCLPASGSYWALFIANSGGAWTAAEKGASSTAVAPGDDVGFRYDPQAGADPPPPSPTGTCPVVTAATPVPSVRPRATSSAPAKTPGSSATATPTASVVGATPSPADTVPPTGARQVVASSPATSINVGLLAAGCGIGGLLGLLGAQALRRRRR
jgi:hypothetical protein